MKKIIITIISIAIIQQNLYATVVSDLESSIKQFEDGISQIDGAKKQLSETYTQIKTDVIDTLNKAIPPIEENSNSLKDVSDQLSGLPDWVLTMACIKDLKSTLQWIVDNPLNTLKTTLSTVKDKFDSANKNLDPATDPLKILPDLNNAKTHFETASSKMKKLKEAIANMPEE